MPTADNQTNVTGSGTAESATQSIADLLAVDDNDTQAESEAQDHGEVEETEAVEADEDDTEEPEGEEPEGDEEEAEDAEKDESEDEEDAEGDAEEPRFTVKVDGEEVEVTQEELLNGYTRQADYTRKTQALAEERKAAAQELEQARDERQQYANVLERLEQQLQTMTEQDEPNWDQLYQQNPAEWVRQKELWRDKREKLQAVKQEQERIQQQNQQERQEQLAKHIQEQSQKLLDAIPEWKDSTRATQEKKELGEYGLELGFTPEEMQQIYDHRAVVLMRKAMLYDKAKNKRKDLRPAKRKGAPKTATPGTPATPGSKQRKAAEKQRQRLAQTGRPQDAAAVIENLL